MRLDPSYRRPSRRAKRRAGSSRDEQSVSIARPRFVVGGAVEVGGADCVRENLIDTDPTQHASVATIRSRRSRSPVTDTHYRGAADLAYRGIDSLAHITQTSAGPCGGSGIGYKVRDGQTRLEEVADRAIQGARQRTDDHQTRRSIRFSIRRRIVARADHYAGETWSRSAVGSHPSSRHVPALVAQGIEHRFPKPTGATSPPARTRLDGRLPAETPLARVGRSWRLLNISRTSRGLSADHRVHVLERVSTPGIPRRISMAVMA
jgi:hypothetical protein